MRNIVRYEALEPKTRLQAFGGLSLYQTLSFLKRRKTPVSGRQNENWNKLTICI